MIAHEVVFILTYTEYNYSKNSLDTLYIFVHEVI